MSGYLNMIAGANAQLTVLAVTVLLGTCVDWRPARGNRLATGVRLPILRVRVERRGQLTLGVVARLVLTTGQRGRTRRVHHGRIGFAVSHQLALTPKEAALALERLPSDIGNGRIVGRRGRRDDDRVGHGDRESIGCSWTRLLGGCGSGD